MKTISFKEFIMEIDDIAYKNDIPFMGSFELTPLCNLDCKMCYVHLQAPSVKDSILTGRQWISIMQEALDAGMVKVLLTGGEALSHPDFWEIYDFLIKKGVTVTLKTNGLLLNEKNLARLSKYPPRIIDISLYGCNRESYIAVTGYDVFDQILSNIRTVIAAGFTVRLVITPSAYMMPWMEEIMEFARSFETKVVVNQLLIEPDSRTGRKKEGFDLTDKENLIIQKKNRELFPPKFMSREEEEELYGKYEKRPDVSDRGLFCNGGRTGFAVNWDGTLSPCLGFPKEIIAVSTMETGFKKAWKGVNEFVKNYRIPEKCHTCNYNTRCHYCPVQHSSVSIRNLCDLSVCDFWMKYYDEKEAGN